MQRGGGLRGANFLKSGVKACHFKVHRKDYKGQAKSHLQIGGIFFAV